MRAFSKEGIVIPIHEYRCRTCEAISENQVNSHKQVREVIICPECGQDAFKIISSNSFRVGGKYTAANGYAGNGN